MGKRLAGLCDRVPRKLAEINDRQFGCETEIQSLDGEKNHREQIQSNTPLKKKNAASIGDGIGDGIDFRLLVFMLTSASINCLQRVALLPFQFHSLRDKGV